MATKAELLKQAQTAGTLADDVDEADFTKEQLEALVSGDIPVAGRDSAKKPITAPDGHVVLSQEDINARNA